MLVGIDILPYQIAYGINFPVAGHQADCRVIVFRISSGSEIRHILVNQVVQRDNDSLCHAVFLIVHTAVSAIGCKDNVRIFAGSKSQVQLCAPVGAFDGFPFHMDAGLLFQTLYRGHFIKACQGIVVTHRNHNL